MSIVGHLFEYIKIIKEGGIQEWIFKEIQAIDEIDFRFKDKEVSII